MTNENIKRDLHQAAEAYADETPNDRKADDDRWEHTAYAFHAGAVDAAPSTHPSSA